MNFFGREIWGDLARINEAKGLTEQQLRLDEICEAEEAKMEGEAMDEYRERYHSPSGEKYPEIHLSEEVIRTSKEK